MFGASSRPDAALSIRFSISSMVWVRPRPVGRQKTRVADHAERVVAHQGVQQRCGFLEGSRRHRTE
jgi:hypothetical protein